MIFIFFIFNLIIFIVVGILILFFSILNLLKPFYVNFFTIGNDLIMKINNISELNSANIIEWFHCFFDCQLHKNLVNIIYIIFCFQTLNAFPYFLSEVSPMFIHKLFNMDYRICGVKYFFTRKYLHQSSANKIIIVSHSKRKYIVW